MLHPEYTFHSDSLKPNYFSEDDNAYIYYAVSELAKRNVTKIDAYNIINILNSKQATKAWAEKLSPEVINDLIENSKYIARDSLAAYDILVQNVIEKAFCRNMVLKLQECERLCYGDDTTKIQSKIYSEIDDLISSYYIGNDLSMFSDKIDSMWREVQLRQENIDEMGYPSKFPEANKYFSYEKGELILVCAPRKEGKSIFCINELTDKLERGAKVLMISSEMTDEQQYIRLLAHLSGVTVKDIKNKAYDENAAKRIIDANQWLKAHPFVHYYMTTLDLNKVYLIAKRLKNTIGLDFMIVDYIKSEGSISSSEIYNMMGEYINMLKNQIAGELNIPILAAAQLNRAGEIADSYKLEQVASTVCVFRKKTDEEWRRDGAACGSHKLFIKSNRLGDQMGDIDKEYIDLSFRGGIASIEQAPQQHIIDEPY